MPLPIDCVTNRMSINELQTSNVHLSVEALILAQLVDNAQYTLDSSL